MRSFFGTYHELTLALARRLAGELGSCDPLVLVAHPVGIIVPSSGVAHAIADELTKTLRKPIAGIAIQTIDSLARTIVARTGKLPRIASEIERRLTLDASIDPSLATTPGIRVMLDRTLRDVRDSGTSLTELSNRSARSNDRPRMLSRLIETWRQQDLLLARTKSIDPATLLEQATRALDGGIRIPPQILFGFYDATGIQLALIEALRRADLLDSIQVPVPLDASNPAPGWEYAAGLSNLVQTWSTETTVLSTPPKTPVSIAPRATRHDELRELCRSVRDLLDGGAPPDSIGIVCRSIDPRETRLMAHFAAEFDIPVLRRDMLELRAQRIGRGVSRLLRLNADDFPRTSVIDLLRDGVRLGIEAHEIDDLDAATRRAAIAGGSAQRIERVLQGIASRDSRQVPAIERYLQIVRRLEQIVIPLARPMTGQEWSTALQTLSNVFEPESRDDLAALRSLDEIAASFRRLEPTGLRFEVTAVLDALELGEPILPAQPDHPIWFGDVMSLRGRSFDHLFVFGMQHDRFPQRRTEDPLLHDDDRKALELRRVGDGRSEEQLLFEIVRTAAQKEVRFSYAKSDGFGRILRPSHLLQMISFHEESDIRRRSDLFRDFAVFLPPATAGLAVSEKEQQRNAARLSGKPLSPRLARSIRFQRLEGTRSRFDGFLAVDSELVEVLRARFGAISPTQLEDYGECPQKYLFKKLLKIDEFSDPEHEAQIAVLEKGGLDHRILERFFRERTVTSEPRIAISRYRLETEEHARVHQIVEEEFDRFDIQYPPWNQTIRLLERELTEREVARFLAMDLAELEESDCAPLEFEFAFGTDRKGPPRHAETVPLELKEVTLRIHGIIDRIDTTRDRTRLRVVDYKAGKAMRHKDLEAKIEQGRRLQLALYAIAVQQIFAVDESAVSGLIKPLRTDGKLDTFSFQLDSCAETLRETLSLFASSILAGRFPATPDENVCRYCPMSHSCRTLHHPEQTRVLRDFESARDYLAILDATGDTQ